MAYSSSKSIVKGTVPAIAVVVAAVAVSVLRGVGMQVDSTMETAIGALIAGGTVALVNWWKNRKQRKPQPPPDRQEGAELPGTSIPT